MSDTIHITMIVRKPWQTTEGMARVQERAALLGFEPTVTGRVTVSCKVSPEVFVRMFGVSPTRIDPMPPGSSDFGAPGGYSCERDLAIPSELSDYVEAISVVPPARRLR